MNAIEQWDFAREQFRKSLSKCDFLQLLELSKDVADALEYRAKIEETILGAQKLANRAVS